MACPLLFNLATKTRRVKDDIVAGIFYASLNKRWRRAANWRERLFRRTQRAAEAFAPSLDKPGVRERAEKHIGVLRQVEGQRRNLLLLRRGALDFGDDAEELLLGERAVERGFELCDGRGCHAVRDAGCARDGGEIGLAGGRRGQPAGIVVALIIEDDQPQIFGVLVGGGRERAEPHEQRAV